MTTIHSVRILTLAAAVVAVAHTPVVEARPAAGTIAAQPIPKGAIRYTVAATGNSARYRVREQLLGKDLPNDAIGETTQISGMVTVDSTTGALVAGQSQFVVTTGALKSDSDRRDGYVRGRLLEAAKFPTVEFAPTSVRGLPATTATAPGSRTFELVGDLTVRGVTRPTTWRVTAQQSGGRATGTATTKFTFADFTITPPRVPVLLSVADTIALEYDFTMVREAGARP
jgi:polyisoprenoid-binding protein YceI